MGSDRYPHRLPADTTLAEAARALEDGRLAGEILDAGWRLRYVSTELRNLVGVDDDEGLAYGAIAMIRATIAPDVWRLSEESQRSWWRLDGPRMRHDLGEPDAGELAELGPLADQFLRIAPEQPPIGWAGKFVTSFPDGSEAVVVRLVLRLLDRRGGLVGLLGLYVGGGLRGSVQAMLSRGDDGMFERMAALTDPARRPAAVLFCDLENSGVHSRRLASRSYFELIRELTTAVDAAVIEAGGIVGKHAGDGASAFFLAEQCGGEAGAVNAAVSAARRIQRAADLMQSAEAAIGLNIGIHWGATLVIGQVVTGGRLEVTALGDEVNQAARIQEVCRGGATLVSKDVLERLDPEEADVLGITPDEIAYEIVGEMDHASEKAKRDAGGLAVAELPSG